MSAIYRCIFMAFLLSQSFSSLGFESLDFDKEKLKSKSKEYEAISNSPLNLDESVNLNFAALPPCDPEDTDTTILDIYSCDHFFYDAYGDSHVYDENDSLLFYFTESTIDTIVLQNANDCDSVIILNITIYHSTIETIYVEACDSFYWNVTESWYNSTTLETVTELSEFGCDSIIVLNLKIHNSYNFITTASYCDSFYWNVNNSWYYASIYEVLPFQTVNDCDSNHTLNLTIRYSHLFEVELESCDSMYWHESDEVYYESGTYQKVYTNESNCDSIYVLYLTIHPSYYDTLVAHACDSFYWNINETWYFESDTIVLPFSTIPHGCDSIHVLYLTIYESFRDTIIESGCDSILWDKTNQYYSETGYYSVGFLTAHNCDSIYVLDLTIHESPEDVEETEYLCWDETLPSPNPSVETLTDENGCPYDHYIYYEHLDQPDDTEETEYFCWDETLPSPNPSVETLTDENGCPYTHTIYYDHYTQTDDSEEDLPTCDLSLAGQTVSFPINDSNGCTYNVITHYYFSLCECPPNEPDTECWETATWNTITCEWVITGSQPSEPETECWETATWNDITCEWDISGTQPEEPTNLECWESANFNNVTCEWEITGSQPNEPTYPLCWQYAVFNDITCEWDDAGSPPAEPELGCGESIDYFDNVNCEWVVKYVACDCPSYASNNYCECDYDYCYCDPNPDFCICNPDHDDCDDDLPVTLIDFRAECLENSIKLFWSTASELNSSHYEVLMSRDGLVWEKLATIEAAGTTNQITQYQHSDVLHDRLTYYKLQQFDHDGANEIFGPISLLCDYNDFSISVYPNPTNGNFTVLIQTAESFGDSEVELVDLSGRVILSQSTDINAGSTMLNFDVKAIQPGAYMIRVKGENDKFTPIRVVKM